MLRQKWPQALLLTTLLLGSSPGGCDATTVTVTDRSVAPVEVVSVEGYDFIFPETYVIQVDSGAWIPVSEQSYHDCVTGSEYPSCQDS